MLAAEERVGDLALAGGERAPRPSRPPRPSPAPRLMPRSNTSATASERRPGAFSCTKISSGGQRPASPFVGIGTTHEPAPPSRAMGSHASSEGRRSSPDKVCRNARVGRLAREGGGPVACDLRASLHRGARRSAAGVRAPLAAVSCPPTAAHDGRLARRGGDARRGWLRRRALAGGLPRGRGEPRDLPRPPRADRRPLTPRRHVRRGPAGCVGVTGNVSRAGRRR